MSGVTWEIERDRFGVMVSGPLDVGEAVEVVAADRYRALRAAAEEVVKACE